MTEVEKLTSALRWLADLLEEDLPEYNPTGLHYQNRLKAIKHARSLAPNKTKGEN